MSGLVVLVLVLEAALAGSVWLGAEGVLGDEVQVTRGLRGGAEVDLGERASVGGSMGWYPVQRLKGVTDLAEVHADGAVVLVSELRRLGLGHVRVCPLRYEQGALEVRLDLAGMVGVARSVEDYEALGVEPTDDAAAFADERHLASGYGLGVAVRLERVGVRVSYDTVRYVESWGTWVGRRSPRLLGLQGVAWF